MLWSYGCSTSTLLPGLKNPFARKAPASNPFAKSNIANTTLAKKSYSFFDKVEDAEQAAKKNAGMSSIPRSRGLCRAHVNEHYIQLKTEPLMRQRRPLNRLRSLWHPRHL